MGENQWESEAPAELFTPRFGRSLTLPSNEWVGQGLTKHVYRGGLTLPLKTFSIRGFRTHLQSGQPF